MTPIENKDDAKGRIKESAGALTGDKSLKNEGKADQASGKAKSVIDGVTDKVKGLMGRRS